MVRILVIPLPIHIVVILAMVRPFQRSVGERRVGDTFEVGVSKKSFTGISAS